MTLTAASSPVDAPDAASGAELRSWALLAAGSLAVAGIFAFLLAMSRVPGIERIVTWPSQFFSKGLVIHVVFSLVVWFLTVFAVLVSLATRQIASGPVLAAPLGRAGLALAAMAFPMLFLPALNDAAVPTLNNYIPAIIHPFYYGGLVLLAIGILLPVIRFLINVRRYGTGTDPLPQAMLAGSFVYIMALVSFALALSKLWGTEFSHAFNEHLFWGGGHVLQFLNCLMLLAGWQILSREAFGTPGADPDIFRLATRLIAGFVLPALIFYIAWEAFAFKQTEAFRRLKFVLALPVLLVGIPVAVEILRQRATRGLPWSNLAFLALALSGLVFAAGGVMGLLVTGADTRTPAHYHAVIAGVNLSLMGLMLTVVLPRLQRPPAPGRSLTLQLKLFGYGQFMAAIGLFIAGGYGAPRKTPSGSVDLVSGAMVGMTLNGIGALIAVIGGIMFIITMLRALLAAPPAPATA